MNTKIALSLLANIFLLSACGGVTPVSATVMPTNEIQTNTPSPTTTATSIPFYWQIPTPETASGFPTPLLPVETDPFGPGVPVEQTSFTIKDLYIGKYVLRKWCKTDESIQNYCAITISAREEKQVEIWGFPVRLGAETGTDITGQGYPNIVVIANAGNAAGEVQVTVFEAGDTLREILRAGSRGDIRFEDLNQDHSIEFIGNARVWSKFSNCQILNLPYVLEYDPASSSYVNRTDQYKDILDSTIQWGLDVLRSYQVDHPDSEVPLCHAYGLVSAYLVSGQTEKAWEVIDTNYPAEKAAEYKAGFLSDLKRLLP